jgi:transcriptional regulator with XRE-family HTH domain
MEELFALLTRAQFVEWLKVRRQGESMTAIGRSLGVSCQAIDRWITGTRNPSKTVLILAKSLANGPVDLPPGLPRVKD